MIDRVKVEKLESGRLLISRNDVALCDSPGTLGSAMDAFSRSGYSVERVDWNAQFFYARRTSPTGNIHDTAQGG
jgi:hypothetical protein